jgi:hypothetical protein
MGIHHSRPSVQLTPEDLALVEEQVISAIGGSAGLPVAGSDGSLLITSDGDWENTDKGAAKVGSIKIRGEKEESYPWMEIYPWYAYMVGNDGEEPFSIWLDPSQIAISAPGEGPSDEGLNMYRYEIRLQNNTWSENTVISADIEPSSMSVGEEHYDPETGTGWEWGTYLSTSDIQTSYYYWDNDTETNQYLSLQRNSLNMSYESYGDNVDDEYSLYMQLDKNSSTFHFEDQNGSMSLYTDNFGMWSGNKGINIDHQNGIQFEHYTTWSGEDGQWHWDRDPTFVYGPTQINCGDMWITPLASGISLNNYDASVEIQPHLIPQGKVVKNVGGKLVGVDGYTGVVNTGNWIMTYEAGILVSVEAD